MIVVVVSICGLVAVDVDLPMHRIEPSPGTAPLEAGEPTHKIIEKHKNSINKFSVPPFPLLSNHSNKIIYKLNIKTKAENSEFTQALHKRREGTLRVLIRLSRSSR